MVEGKSEINIKITRRTVSFILLLCLAATALTFFTFSRNEKSEDDAYADDFRSEYSVHNIKLPDSLFFAGEAVPLGDFDVHERMDREILVNTYWQSNTMLSLKLANRYFSVIENILKEESVPDDFKYLALIESGFRPVISSKGAAGFWQFLQETAPDYDLLINDFVDERYNLEKATHAACRYLKSSKELLGSWTAAAAAYNRGAAGVMKQVKLQHTSNYYDLYLNEETSRYVFRILAMKLIHDNPSDFGFEVRKKDLYPPIETVTIKVDSAIEDLPEFAISNKIKYKTLKLLNPWLLQSSLPLQKGRTLEIAVPADNPANNFLFPGKQSAGDKK